MVRKISIKFLIGFLLVFSLSFIALNQTVKEFIQAGNQRLVASELEGLKGNSNVYVRQAFMINHYMRNELYFGDMAEDLANDLHRATGSAVGVYTVDGSLLHASDAYVFPEERDSDLKQAVDGKTAYNIAYEPKADGASVLFAYPVIIDGAKVGILRFAKDFNLLYRQSGRILDIILYSTLIIFAAAFLFSYMLSRHISIPLVKLARASTEVKNGNLDIRIYLRRRDEIGRLADNFNEMIGQLGRQIGIIRHDRDQLKELRQQEKLFFDNVTHELKTPLTSILGYAEMIKKNGESDPDFFHKGMNHIIEESRRLHEMVLKLLETSRATAVKAAPAEVDASALLRDVCESMGMRAQRYRKSLDSSIENSLTLSGYEDRLRQVFINLLDNAIKYSLPQSVITVSALRTGDSLRFRFENPSDPLEADQLAKLFQPFYLAHDGKTEAGSAGLGLSIVQSIVDEMGGTISLANDNGMTSVTVEFILQTAKGRGEET